MRTTLTIDDDVMRELRDIAHREGLPLKQLVNRLLRLGLKRSPAPGPRRAYRCPTFAMGVPSGVNLDKALAVASGLEDAEIARKMEMRK